MRPFLAFVYLILYPNLSQAAYQSMDVDGLDEITRVVLVSNQSGKSPCAASPFSSQSQSLPLTFRPGEVGVYSWHMCVWKSELLTCGELLNVS